jgi:hypothetical protein
LSERKKERKKEKRFKKKLKRSGWKPFKTSNNVYCPPDWYVDSQIDELLLIDDAPRSKIQVLDWIKADENLELHNQVGRIMDNPTQLKFRENSATN